MISRHSLLCCALLALLALGTSGCVIALGNKDLGPNTRKSTLGQELIDLKKARESGAITQEEYEMQKKRLVEHQK